MFDNAKELENRCSYGEVVQLLKHFILAKINFRVT